MAPTVSMCAQASRTPAATSPCGRMTGINNIGGSGLDLYVMDRLGNLVDTIISVIVIGVP
jgi:hypothetical protein